MSKIHTSLTSTRVWLFSQSKRIFTFSENTSPQKATKPNGTAHHFGPQVTVRLARKKLRDQKNS